jgi:hypothetical protein
MFALTASNSSKFSAKRVRLLSPPGFSLAIRMVGFMRLSFVKTNLSIIFVNIQNIKYGFAEFRPQQALFLRRLSYLGGRCKAGIIRWFHKVDDPGAIKKTSGIVGEFNFINRKFSGA